MSGPDSQSRSILSLQQPPPTPAPRVRMVRSGKPGRAAVDVARIHAEEGRDAGRLR